MVSGESSAKVVLLDGYLRSWSSYLGALTGAVFSGCTYLFSVVGALFRWSRTGLDDLICSFQEDSY